MYIWLRLAWQADLSLSWPVVAPSSNAGGLASKPLESSKPKGHEEMHSFCQVFGKAQT